MGGDREEEEGRMKEVGCQSEAAETREAGVQVDLLSVSDTLEQHKSPNPCQPAPAPTTRNRILVLDRGKGQKVFLVMNQNVTTTVTERAKVLQSLIQQEAPQSTATPVVQKGSDQTPSPDLVLFPSSVPLSQQTLTSPAHGASRTLIGSRSSSPPKPRENPNSPERRNVAAPFQPPAIIPKETSQDLKAALKSPPPSRHLSANKNKILVMNIAGRKVLVVNRNTVDASGSFCKPHPFPQLPANQSSSHRASLARLSSSSAMAQPTYLCEFCGLRCASISLVRQHRWHIHGAPSAICRVCGQGFSHRSRMAKHKDQKHTSCQLCKRTFSHWDPLTHI